MLWLQDLFYSLSPALFSKYFQILYIFTQIFKYFALFNFFLSFLWKIPRMLLLSKIGPGLIVFTHVKCLKTLCNHSLKNYKCTTARTIYSFLSIKGSFLRLWFLRFYSFQITIDHGFIAFLSDCAANIFSLFTF